MNPRKEIHKSIYCINISDNLLKPAMIISNVDCLLASNKDERDNSAIAWVGPSKQRYGLTKFKLIY